LGHGMGWERALSDERALLSVDLFNIDAYM
jgi:hypothetical protein